MNFFCGPPQINLDTWLPTWNLVSLWEISPHEKFGVKKATNTKHSKVKGLHLLNEGSVYTCHSRKFSCMEKIIWCALLPLPPVSAAIMLFSAYKSPEQLQLLISVETGLSFIIGSILLYFTLIAVLSGKICVHLFIAYPFAPIYHHDSPICYHCLVFFWTMVSLGIIGEAIMHFFLI